MSILRAIKPVLHSSLSDVLTTLGYPDTQIIYSNQNGLEPDKSYGVINILQINQVGRSDEASFIVPTSDILEFVTHHTLSIQISFIGTESDSIAYDFRHGLINNRRCFEALLKNNFGIASRGDVRRVPQKRESAWVEAYNMDIDLTFSIFTRQSYDWVEYVDINGERFHIWTRG